MDIKKFFQLKSVRDFLREHSRVEKLPRTVCEECQFESNEEYPSHAPGCSKDKKNDGTS